MMMLADKRILSGGTNLSQQEGLFDFPYIDESIS